MARDTSLFGRKTFRWLAGSPKFADEIVKRYGDRAVEVVKRAVTDMGDDIMDNSGFLTGRLRGHWKVGVNSMPGGYDAKLEDPSRRLLFDPEPLEKMKLTDRIYIYNKAPYAAIIEAIGSHTTAPGQMVQQQRLGWQGYVDRAAKDLGVTR